MFCSLLGFTKTPRSANALARSLGLYFQAMGVKRRVLGVLAGLGVTEGYRAVTDQRSIIADSAKESNSLSPI